ASMSQPLITPPPSPPRAQTSTVMGRWALCIDIARSGRLQEAQRRAAHAGQEFFVPLRVLHHLGLVEARAKRGGMGVGAAQAAAHATIDHRGYRVHSQWVGVVLDRE